MSRIPFWKMDGAGNDFVVVNGDHVSTDQARSHAGEWCHRHRGIGADGVLRVGRIAPDRAEMVYLNPDGSDAFCGNGLRCAAVFAEVVLGVPALSRVETTAGPLAVGSIAPPSGPTREWSVEVAVPGPEGDARAVDLRPVWSGPAYRLVAGVPHLILPVDDVEAIDLVRLGPAARRHAAAGAEGANVNVVTARGPCAVHMRTYERGVEAETQACGSGAVAVARWLAGGTPSHPVAVTVREGACLTVRWDGETTWLGGPVRLHLSGEWWGEAGTTG